MSIVEQGVINSLLIDQQNRIFDEKLASDRHAREQESLRSQAEGLKREKERQQQQANLNAGQAYLARKQAAKLEDELDALNKDREAFRQSILEAIRTILVDSWNELKREGLDGQAIHDRILAAAEVLYAQNMAIPGKPTDKELDWYRRCSNSGAHMVSTENRPELYAVHKKVVYWQAQGFAGVMDVKLIENLEIFDQCAYGDLANYVGTTENGVACGQGRFTYPSGKIYSGTFTQGMPNGEGETVFPDGKIHRGAYCDGLPSGQGTLLAQDGKVICEGRYYEAAFQEGAVTRPDGLVEKGHFRNDRLNGQGSRDGSSVAETDFLSMVGLFEAGFLKQGEIRFKGGEVQSGVFELCKNRVGIYASYELVEGKKMVPMENGKIFECEWRDWGAGMRYGKGFVVYPDGGRKKAEMINGVVEELGLFKSVFG